MSGVEWPPGTLRTRVKNPVSVELAVESFKRAIGQIGRRLGSDDDWAPTLLLQSDEEQVSIPIGVLFEDERGKELAAILIPRLIRVAHARLAALVTTAWMLEGDPAQEHYEGSGPPPSESPKRIEVVSLMVASREGEQFHHAKIVRRPGHPPALREWKSMTTFHPGASLGGRFGDALRTGIASVER